MEKILEDFRSIVEEGEQEIADLNSDGCKMFQEMLNELNDGLPSATSTDVLGRRMDF